VDYEGRISNLQKKLTELDAQALLITNLTNVRYLTGFSGSNAQVLVTGDAAHFMTDGRYRARAADLVHGADVTIYPNRLTEALEPKLKESDLSSVAVESKTMTLSERDDLAKRLDGVDLVVAGGVVEELRQIKEPAEVDKLRDAIAVGDAAYAYIIERLAPGKTEREVALDLEVYMRTNGADEISFEPIVGSGPLSAHIHHTPSERVFEPGDFVLLDFGARVDGYCGDLTRTVVLGAATDEQRRQYEAVLAANASALGAMTPGAGCKAIDALARKTLSDAGFDDFGHGLGHGLGLDVHESPRFSRISEDTLAAGMVMTNEPGLYFEAPGGVRIEDCVLITETGAEVLTGAPKDKLLEL